MKLTYLISGFLLVQFLAAGQQGKEFFLLTGTYTSGKSEGIYIFTFNTASGESKLVSTVKTDNPSFLAIDPKEKFVYTTNENLNGQITAFSFDK
ncbi:MAG TPA: beta-propeller fold lactonase family protein, partial [Chitinophagaceae bacterium]|nr:beta-propeller fold lactonase family protein [Chitinophagaceae bacterium]